jgi:hypothetical protein
MSEVKRFRADHRHVVETEFDDAQYVLVADYDASQSEVARLEGEFDTLEHTNITLKLSLAESSASLQLATRLLASSLSALNPRAGLAKNVRAFLDSQRKPTEPGASA